MFFKIFRTRHFILKFLIIAILILSAVFAYNKFNKFYYPMKYTDLVEKYAKENGLETALVYAVINCESSFDPNAKSSVPAYGLMQITSDTFAWANSKLEPSVRIDESDFLDPEINIKYGTFILARHIGEFKSVETALAAYHAGRAKVIEWLATEKYSADGETLDKIPYDDTNHYVNKVLRVRKKYIEIYSLGEDSKK